MTTKVSPGMTRRPRSYSDIVRLLVNEAATKLETQPKPAYTLGVPTVAMLRLARRHRQAAEIVATCERQLKERGANVVHGKLSLHYEKRAVLEKDWRTRHEAAAAKIRALKMSALVDLINRPPAEAKEYLQRLRMLLDAAVQGAAK